MFMPQPGYVEQDPEEWWQAVCTACQRLFQKTGILPQNIAGIGIDGQSWSAIPVDSDGNVLRKTPIWMDTRAEQVCRKYAERIGEDAIFQICGNPFSPSYTLPKILYFMEQEPELVKKTDKFLQSNSFIIYRLTGVISQDLSQSYAYHNFNQHTLQYDTDLTKEMGIPKRFILDMVPSDIIVGKVSKTASRLTGLQEGTPVVAGGLDAACSSLGAGVVREGQVQEQGGQAGGMSICIGSALSHKRLILSPHVVRGKWLLQGGTAAGGGSMNWFAEQFGAKDGDVFTAGKKEVFKKLSREAEMSEAGANGIVFLPYLNGERSPIWDVNAKGVYFGFGLRSEHKDFARAVMEGVAFSLRHNLECAGETGAEIQELYATGGSAESNTWMQIKSNISELPIHVLKTTTATTWGAAILAGIGTGVFKNAEEAVKSSVMIQKSYWPEKRTRSLYNQYFEIYKELYIETKETMHKLDKIVAGKQEGVHT